MTSISEELSELLKKLQVTSEKDDLEDTGLMFEKLIKNFQKREDNSKFCHELIEAGVLNMIMKALKNGSKDEQTKAAELVAELAKVENCRISCVDDGLVPVLVQKMASEETSTALQACRALGNICYEYDGGRCSVLKAGGETYLLELLQRASHLPETPENHQLRLVATGFLLNLLNSYDSSEDHPMDAPLVEILCQYLEKFAEDEDIPTHVLLSLSCMADSDLSRGMVVSWDITPQLVKILNKNESSEVIETCLELITNLAETECVKTQFAMGGVCQAVIDVVKRYMDDTSPELATPIIKTATDLIVLILVGDDSMGVVYGNGEGPVYHELISWLTSDLEDLKIAGALAMGNFARNDSHCVHMVKSGIAEMLLRVLSTHNTMEGDIRLQHALLSALRNLSIAKQNKPIVIKQGALDVLVPMATAIETYPVVFKLLATLRMIIDGQTAAAIQIGKNQLVIMRMVSWCSTIEHPGVQGEASRILAWLVKNCDGDENVISTLVEAGALVPLVVMLTSEHHVMVNEAALALALIFAKDVSSLVINTLKETPFVPNVTKMIKDQMYPPEVVGNILATLLALCRSDSALQLIQSDELSKALEILISGSNEDLKSVANKLKEIFEIEK